MTRRTRLVAATLSAAFCGLGTAGAATAATPPVAADSDDFGRGPRGADADCDERILGRLAADHLCVCVAAL